MQKTITKKLCETLVQVEGRVIVSRNYLLPIKKYDEGVVTTVVHLAIWIIYTFYS